MFEQLQQAIIGSILILYAMLYAFMDFTTNTGPVSIYDGIWYAVEAAIFLFWGAVMLLINKGKLKRLWLILDVYFLIRLIMEIQAMISGVSINEKYIALIMFITVCSIILYITLRWK